jgi:hypothetical protein
MFEIKKMISQFLMPVPVVTVVFLVGWGLVQFSRYRRTGRVLQGLALLLFVAFAYGVGTDRYLYRLERRYPSVELEDAGFERICLRLTGLTNPSAWFMNGWAMFLRAMGSECVWVWECVGVGGVWVWVWECGSG